MNEPSRRPRGTGGIRVRPGPFQALDRAVFLFLGTSIGWGFARGEPRWPQWAFLAFGVLLSLLARYLRRRAA